MTIPQPTGSQEFRISSRADSIFDPPNGSLRKSVGRGALATGIAQLLKIATQIASVVLLSRLLSPNDFGVVAMAAPALGFIMLFQDLGLTQATVQRSTIGHGEVNYLFWINVGVSAALALLLAGASPLVAAFYNDGRVGPLVAAMSLQIIVSSLGAQHSALLNRRMEFGLLAAIDVGTAMVTLLASVAWALIDHSYWALFAGSLAGALLGTTWSWIGSRWRPGLPRRLRGANDLLVFGAGITGFNFANFFSRNLDNVLIGRYWGNEQLGLYDRAYKLLLFPLNQITNPLQKVMVPALSRLVAEPERYRSAYLRVVPVLLLVAMPGVAFAVALADDLIPLALGEQWRASAGIFRALGIASLIQLLNNPTGWLFVSQGRASEFMRWGFASAITSIVAFAIGLPFGALGVAIAYAASEYIRTPFLWWYVGRRGPLGAGHMFNAALPIVLGAFFSLSAVWFVGRNFPGQGIPALAGAVIFSYCATIAVMLQFPSGRETLRVAINLVPLEPFKRFAVLLPR